MHSAPVPADGGRDDSQPGTPPGPDQDPPGAGDAWEPVITRSDPMTEEERQAWLDALDEPFDPGEYPDPDGPPPPGEDELTAAEIAEIREATEAAARAAVNGARAGTTGALAAIAALGGRRGPGPPGSAQVVPGESASRAAAFGSGLTLDVMPGGPDLAMLADARSAGGRGSDQYRRLRSPVPGPGSRSRGQAPAPSPGPARYLHQPGLPTAC